MAAGCIIAEDLIVLDVFDVVVYSDGIVHIL